MTTARRWLLLASVLTLALALREGLAAAQATPEATPLAAPRPAPRDDARSRLERITRGELPLPEASEPARPAADPMAPEPPPSASRLDLETQRMYQAALREYYAYRIAGLQQRQRVFTWQLLSARIIFVVVLLMVASGIYFAAVQFHVGLHKDAAPATTEVVASLKEIKVTSPVLGVIILVLSLAFFYCYLVFVYPIEEIF